MVGEAYAYVQGESLKACAVFLFGGFSTPRLGREKGRDYLGVVSMHGSDAAMPTRRDAYGGCHSLGAGRS